jgi:hypothetical protein
MEMLIDVGIKIGPVTGIANDFGAKITIKNDEPNGNIGPYKVDMQFVGPKGIALSIKKDPIFGAGFLYASDGEYRGGLYIKLKKFNLTALGIISTKMPDGSAGFSLLILISAEFTPINIGFGLTLNGVGGMLGLHRSFSTDNLRAGVKNGSVDHILFPNFSIKDPKDNHGQVDSNASQIMSAVSEINQLFPIKKDQFIAGPMVKLGWGSGKDLATLSIGVFIEFANPVRLAILGKLSILAPDKELPACTINVAFVGIIDFDAKYFSFDATIYDSHILKVIQLSGDIAVRVFWGEYPEMVLAIGGFHPAFSAPAFLKLPSKFDRITLSLLNYKNDDADIELSLKLQLYLAITSNTVQFGSRLDLLIQFWKVKIVGLFGFDVLFQFNPFKFQSQVYATLTLSMYGEELLAINMDFQLEGPGPWHALGFAEFTLFWTTKKFNFEHTWGEQLETSVASVDVGSLIKAELEKKESWSTILPKNIETSVHIRPTDSIGLVVDTMGKLCLSQKVAPLDITLDKFGPDKPTVVKKYSIDSVFFNGNTSGESISKTKENFAPAQFRNMSDEQKLKSPSFEFLNAGVAIESDAFGLGNSFVAIDVEYDLVVIDDDFVEKKLNIKLPYEMCNAMIKGGIIANNEISKKWKAIPDAPLLKVNQETFAIASKDTKQSIATKPTLTEALDYLQYQQPILQKDFHCIPA